MTMIYEEKLDLILKALVEARKATGTQYHPRLYRDKDNKLDSLSFDQIQDILLQLEDDEKVIAIKSIPTEMKSLSEQTTSDLLDKKRDYFVIEILDSFNDWYSNFLIKERSKIENLSGINLKNITYILPLIEQELELSQSNKVVISFVSSGDEISGYDTYDIDNVISTYTKCLSYLKSIGIIEDFTSEPMSVSSELTVNVPKFFEALEKIKKLNGKTEVVTSAKTIQTDKTTKATYDPKKGVLDIEGKTVRLKKDSFRAKLLELLLKNDEGRKKEWSWDEVIEEIEGVKGEDNLKENKKKFYPACDGLSKFIAQKTGVNDFLLFNKSTVQINPKYI